MKSSPSPHEKKPSGTRAHLELVAPNLYRHKLNGSYYGQRKIGKARKTHALGTSDRKSADRLLRDWLGKTTGTGASQDMTLGQLVEKFLAARTGLSESTKTTDDGIAKQFRQTFPRPMTTLVTRIVYSDLAAWLAKIKPACKKNATYNRKRLFVRQLFEMAEADEVVDKSPFKDRLLKPAKKQKVDRPIPTPEEFAKIIAEIRSPAWEQTKGKAGGQRPMGFPESADFVEFMGLAGLGQAEASSLEWKNVSAREMKLVRKKTGKEFYVVIPDALKPLLARRREEAGGESAAGFVFTIKNPKRAIANALKRLGMRHFTARNFRSWRIVGMLDRGVDVKFIAAQQGHQDGGTLILSTYSEVIRANQKAYEDEQMARANGVIVKFKSVA